MAKKFPMTRAQFEDFLSKRKTLVMKSSERRTTCPIAQGLKSVTKNKDWDVDTFVADPGEGDSVYLPLWASRFVERFDDKVDDIDIPATRAGKRVEKRNVLKIAREVARV